MIYTDNPEAKEELKDEDIEFVDVDIGQMDIGESKLRKFVFIKDCL